jgi:hypothetical protein
MILEVGDESMYMHKGGLFAGKARAPCMIDLEFEPQFSARLISFSTSSTQFLQGARRMMELLSVR